jgi:hypothetical protein
LLSVFPNQANLGGGDLFVETLRFFLSDGSNLQKIQKSDRHTSAAFFMQQTFDQGLGGHLPEILIAAGT